MYIDNKYIKYFFLKLKGDRGDTFFFIEEGECVAMKILIPGQMPEVVLKYKKGDYFGELALLRDNPRAASIVAEVIYYYEF